MILARLDLVDTHLINIKAHHTALFAKLNGQRQTNIAKTNNG